ncbi:arsenite efflux transporter metallochaperone ArsD [Marinococcus luteus]|uniref:arsenite efflux transporter metallochaperone ArsD n=1 Tax=Marinococcus luteus TaxID=1122204 RepID=UPI002ACCD8F1|nr:arsenite efflux transporter metallochaperone ArsD [Marinococcus luteus]MDZ5784603.1 arsenite efflux transporter metallochaperone ArsD [Marinococcus luteus]
MTKVRIYDPAMCCDTGVCGPGTDPELVRIASAVERLQQKGHDIERYNLANQPEEFAAAGDVTERITADGIEALPVIMKDGAIVMTAEYPDVGQLADWFDTKVEELQPERSVPTVELSFNTRYSK